MDPRARNISPIGDVAAGNQLWLQAAYSNGNVSYISPGNGGVTPGFGGFALAASQDAYVAPLALGGDIERTRGFNLVAAFLHCWTPQIRQGLYHGWKHIGIPAVATTIPNALGQLPGASTAIVDQNVYEIGTNLIWSPVAGLDLGVEVLYGKAAARNGRVQIFETVTPGVVSATNEFKRSEDQFQARLRIQRDF